MEKTTLKSPLIDKKLLVVPVRRKGGWLPDGHAAQFLHNNSYWRAACKRDQRTGLFVDPLTHDERTFFESSKSGMALKEGDLSIYKEEKNYWENFTIKLRDEVRVLDLMNPKDYITWKVLLTNSDTIAPSAADKFSKGTYKFVIQEEGYQDDTRVKANSNKKEAYKFLGKIDTSKEKMRDFLGLYLTNKPGGKSVPPDAKESFLIAELDKIIETDLSGFLALARDKDYDKKLLVLKGLKARAITRKGMEFQTAEGQSMGVNLQEAIAYLDNPLHSEEVIKIKQRIENAK